jgi:hypothetical protein
MSSITKEAAKLVRRKVHTQAKAVQPKGSNFWSRNLPSINVRIFSIEFDSQLAAYCS